MRSVWSLNSATTTTDEPTFVPNSMAIRSAEPTAVTEFLERQLWSSRHVRNGHEAPSALTRRSKKVSAAVPPAPTFLSVAARSASYADPPATQGLYQISSASILIAPQGHSATHMPQPLQ
jgi:hypothetical protein